MFEGPVDVERDVQGCRLWSYNISERYFADTQTVGTTCYTEIKDYKHFYVVLYILDSSSLS